MKHKSLQSIIRRSISIENPVALQFLIDYLIDEHDTSIQGIIFYGSCLRSLDLYDGLVDLYLIVDNYKNFHKKYLPAIANKALPPNVYYLEIMGPDDRKIRAKYAIISQHDFIKGTSKKWFHSYIWGRFTQPVALPYVKDEKTREIIIDCLSNSILTFLTRIIPQLEKSGSIENIWVQGMQLSYRAELRAETSQRASVLIENQPDYYAAITAAAARQIPLNLTVDDNKYTTDIHPAQKRLSRITWFVRITQGKALSVLRLLKALFTFTGGLDYIAWKLERHSGQSVQIPDRVRKYPLIFIWGLFWKLYRKGVFR